MNQALRMLADPTGVDEPQGSSSLFAPPILTEAPAAGTTAAIFSADVNRHAFFLSQ